MFMKRNYIVFIIIVFTILFAGCKKSEPVDDKVNLTVNLNSIYEISKVKIAIFEGWVDAGLQDVYENSKRFYAVHRSNNANTSVRLDRKPYTILVYYEDFGLVYSEKIDLKNDDPTINFYWGQVLPISIRADKLVYTKNETLKLDYGSISYLGGVKFRLFLNQQEVFRKDEKQVFEYTLNKVGINQIDFHAIYKDGQTNIDKYNVVVVSRRHVEDIWNNIDEKYIKQKIFNDRSLISFARDTVIFNNLIKANPIIDGIYGEYKFKYFNGTMNEIEVIHGNLINNPYLRLHDIKNQMEAEFGKPTQHSFEHYSFKLGDFKLVLLQDRYGTIKTTISKI